MSFWVYLLRCRDGSFYAGHTDNLERRIKGWARAKKEALIAGDWRLIGELARPPHERPSTSLRTNGEEYGVKDEL